MAGIRRKATATTALPFQGTATTSPSATPGAGPGQGAEVDETLGLIERGRLTSPTCSSKSSSPPAERSRSSARPETIRPSFDHYLRRTRNGTIEANSLHGRTHLNQVAADLGERFRIQRSRCSTSRSTSSGDGRRASPPSRSRRRSPPSGPAGTGRSTAGWSRASSPAGPAFPKEEEKEPFRTFAEIEAIIAAENPDDAPEEALWEVLYLTRPEVEEFLAYVRRTARCPGFTRWWRSPPTPGHGGARCCGRWSPTWT